MRACAFCGNTDSELASAEDLFPHWYSKAIRRTLPATATVAHHSLSSDGTHKVFPSQRIKFQAPVVCTSCNTGWMSTLEKAVKPILLPLLLDASEPVLLNAEQRLTISAWLTV
jgi:hypothetical protein